MMYVLCFKKEQARKHQERERKKEVKNVPKNKFDIWFTIKHFK